MKICSITYQEIAPHETHSKKGLRALAPALTRLNDFPHTAEEQRSEAMIRSTKLSIQGVQPKLSVNLSVKEQEFRIVEFGGRYILKPQVEEFRNLPENENLTMKLAAHFGIEVPLNGLVRSIDGSLSYFIRRFDRKGQKEKVHIEDFAQLTGQTRDTKYDSSMEKVAETIRHHCTFPLIEAQRLLDRMLFSFVVGNEDMHLKNFSIIVRNEKVELSPAYDLVNSTLAMEGATEESALSIRGKKRNLKRGDFIDYFAIERLGLVRPVAEASLARLGSCLWEWESLIEKSFLPTRAKSEYLALVKNRLTRLALR